MSEQSLHIAVANYLRLQYPHVIFTAEASGLHKSKAVAGIAKMLRSGSKLPDMWILEPMNGWHGLLIELKIKPVTLRDGTLSKDKHIQGQAEVIQRLRAKGYRAAFACGFDEARKIIDWYMRPKLDHGTIKTLSSFGKIEWTEL